MLDNKLEEVGNMKRTDRNKINANVWLGFMFNYNFTNLLKISNILLLKNNLKFVKMISEKINSTTITFDSLEITI